MKRAVKSFLFLWFAVVLFFSCENHSFPNEGDFGAGIYADDSGGGQFVSIQFNIPQGEYSMTIGNKLELKASVKGGIVREPVYSWKLNGAELSNSLDLVFEGTGAGILNLVFNVTAENGRAEKTFRLTVQEKPQVNTPLYFDYGKYRNENTQAVGTYTVPKGRRLVLSPARNFRELTDTAVYEWALDGVIQPQAALPPYTLFPCYFEFDSSAYEVGDVRTVTVYVRDRNKRGAYQASAKTYIEIVPKEGTYKRPAAAASSPLADRVMEFTPAPGRYIRMDNTGYPPVPIAPGRTEGEIRSETESYMLAFGSEWSVSLGAWGGYIVMGFDHSVDSQPGHYSFSIDGDSVQNRENSWNEPGVVWVSQDENGNGFADDTWFELRASETGKEGTVQLYRVTYHAPDPVKGIEWEDNAGGKGAFPYLSPDDLPLGWPWHTGGDTVTFTGTLLPSHLFIALNEKGELVEKHYAYPYGYADNNSEYDSGIRTTNFRISDAMLLDGRPANLAYIDFIKIQCAALVWADEAGEVSTEIGRPADYVMTY